VEPRCLGKKSDPGRSGEDNRRFVEAVLWIARTGSPWRDLPPLFGPWNTFFKRYRESLKSFERALDIDPQSVDARIGIAIVLATHLNSGFVFRASPTLDRAELLLREALAADGNSSMAHAAMGFVRRVEDRQAEAEAEICRHPTAGFGGFPNRGRRRGRANPQLSRPCRT